jgi:hypothetical protein
LGKAAGGEGIDAPLPRCAIHGDAIADVAYFCPSCRRWFCKDCVDLYILDARGKYPFAFVERKK